MQVSPERKSLSTTKIVGFAAVGAVVALVLSFLLFDSGPGFELVHVLVSLLGAALGAGGAAALGGRG